MSRVWPAYRTVRELVHSELGRPAVVMGGGCTLMAALDRIAQPERCVYISANDHGAKALRARNRAGEHLSYVLCLDKIEDRCRREQWEGGRIGPAWNVPLVSRHMFADYRILEYPQRDSGAAAAWFARLLGCAPVILAGMDCYRGGVTYWHTPKAKSSATQFPDEVHLGKWRSLRDRYEAQYQAASGAVSALFPDLDLSVAPSPALRYNVVTDLAGEWMEFLSDHELTGRPFRKGTVIEIKKQEARVLEKKKVARKCEAPA